MQPNKLQGRRRNSRLAETTVVLDVADTLRLDALAQEKGQSRSALIREAIRARLPVWKREAAREDA